MERRSLVHHTKVYMGLGSNVGNKEANLAQAFKLLPPDVTVARISSLYETEPVGYKDQPWFLNCVCCAYTDLSPPKLLDYVKHIEEQLGRLLSFRNAPRPIDIDLLFYGDETVDSDQLTIPHPRVHERAFTLAPLVELDPAHMHPVRRQTISQLLADVELEGKIKRRNWSPLFVDDLIPSPTGHMVDKDKQGAE